jgi:hypothetical protein
MRPALQRAAAALCGAATLEAAQAAARALDVACMQAFGADAAIFLTVGPRLHAEETERIALREVLTRGVTPQTLLALLRCESPRNVHLAFGIFSCHIPGSASARADELHTREVLHTLMNAALSMEAAAAENSPLSPAEATRSGVILREVGAANVLITVLNALSVTVAGSPRAAARLEAAPQREALLQMLARAYKPCERQTDEKIPGAPLLMHIGALSVLLTLSAAGSHGRAVLWNSETRPSIVQELLGCLEAQACHPCVRCMPKNDSIPGRGLDAVFADACFACFAFAACRRRRRALGLPHLPTCRTSCGRLACCCTMSACPPRPQTWLALLHGAICTR